MSSDVGLTQSFPADDDVGLHVLGCRVDIELSSTDVPDTYRMQLPTSLPLVRHKSEIMLVLFCWF